MKAEEKVVKPDAAHEGGEVMELARRKAKAPRKLRARRSSDLKALYRDGLVTNVYFTQFIVQ